MFGKDAEVPFCISELMHVEKMAIVVDSQGTEAAVASETFKNHGASHKKPEACDCLADSLHTCFFHGQGRGCE